MPLTVLDQGADAPLSLRSQILVGGHQIRPCARMCGVQMHDLALADQPLRGSVDGRLPQNRVSVATAIQI